MLTGSAFFDFGIASHRLHQLVERAVAERVSVLLTWKAVAAATELDRDTLGPATRLLAAHQVIRDRQRQRRFRQAVFAMVHRHGDDPADPVTLRAGVKVAGMDWGVVEEAVERTGKSVLDDVRAAAEEAGVDGLPAIMGAGPAVTVLLTPAAASGSSRAKLDVIERMAKDDGIWALTKPEHAD